MRGRSRGEGGFWRQLFSWGMGIVIIYPDQIKVSHGIGSDVVA